MTTEAAGSGGKAVESQKRSVIQSRENLFALQPVQSLAPENFQGGERNGRVVRKIAMRCRNDCAERSRKSYETLMI